MNILLATDGSVHSQRALGEAAHLMPFKDANLYLLAVAPTLKLPVSAGPAGFAGASVMAQAEALSQLARSTDQHLAAGQKILSELGFAVTLLERGGDPAEEILKAAREVGADLIVMGSHGYGLAERFLMGSVSVSVLHHATMPVLVVPPQRTS